MFIGREKELKFLNNIYNSEGGQLVVLYGRRRIGKTETLRYFSKDKPHVFFSCRECADRLQLQNFSKKILEQHTVIASYIKEFNEWDALFESISSLPYGENKRLVIIDEFPYMCKGNNSIPSMLQNLWDEKLKDENVMIVLCGSAMSFIEKELLSDKNPLYGRTTGIYKMKEMGFYDAIKFFPNYSNKDKFLAYAILGGVPHYLKQFSPDKLIEDNIKDNILTKGCPLYTEVEFMLRQELRETALYNSIVEVIALGSTKLNEISNKVMMESTAKTSVYLKNLLELGIIEKEHPVGETSKTRSKVSRGLYRITDNFFKFWYAFVFKNYTELEAGDVDGVFKYEIQPHLNEHASYIFEYVCKQYIMELNMAGELPFRYKDMGRWWGKTKYIDEQGKVYTKENEVDIVAINSDKNKYLIGECKLKNKAFTYAEYIEMTRKLNINSDALKYYWLFSLSGFEDKILKVSKENNNISLVSLDEIVDYMDKKRN